MNESLELNGVKIVPSRLYALSETFSGLKLKAVGVNTLRQNSLLVFDGFCSPGTQLAIQ